MGLNLEPLPGWSCFGQVGTIFHHVSGGQVVQFPASMPPQGVEHGVVELDVVGGVVAGVRSSHRVDRVRR